ncbi:MAG: hypothetical protein AB7D05_06415 [Mangrovibacterium sp.]
MTEQDQILLADFKARLRLLFRRHDQLKNEKKTLATRVEELGKELELLRNKHIELLGKYENIKIARALAGSEEGRELAKERINNIVREIDRCIAQLNV